MSLIRNLAVAGLLVVILSACSPQKSPLVQSTPAPVMEKADTTEGSMKEGSASQINFTTEEAAQKSAGTGPVVYFFKASWCPSCQALQRDLDARINDLPAGTTIVTVDYDTETELKKKYGITYQHTLVQIDESGKEIAKWQGGGVDTIGKNIIANK